MNWTRKHLLDIESLSADEIRVILDTTRAFKAVGERTIKKVPALRGRTVINLFVEPSTRTRISFELAAMRLNADVINFTAETSSLTKGETLLDTGKTLEVVRDLMPNAHFATVYAKPKGKPMVDSYITEVSQDTWIFFPWDMALQYVEPYRGKD